MSIMAGNEDTDTEDCVRPGKGGGGQKLLLPSAQEQKQVFTIQASQADICWQFKFSLKQNY